LELLTEIWGFPGLAKRSLDIICYLMKPQSVMLQ